MTESVIQMENRPGRLAALTETLAAFGVNIEALAAYATDGIGTVRLISGRRHNDPAGSWMRQRS